MDLQRRIERLERENKRFKRLGTAALLLVVIAVSMGQTPRERPKTIKAQQFVIVDEKGTPRGQFGIEKGSAKLSLAHKNGKRTVELRTLPNGRSALHFLDTNGTPRVELAIAKQGPVLNFIGENSALRASLAGAGPDSRLDLYQQDGGKIFKVTTGDLVFFDADGTTVEFSRP